ncbi:MAG: hypothetical protein CML54_05395 [Rhodobacteraceae bacterium]|nr:hypothetical protein [Paracoccaceae bacterium]
MATHSFILSKIKVGSVRSCSAFGNVFPNLDLKLSQTNKDTLAKLKAPKSLLLNSNKLKKLIVRCDEKFYL